MRRNGNILTGSLMVFVLLIFLKLPALNAQNASFHNAPASADQVKNPYAGQPRASEIGGQPASNLRPIPSGSPSAVPARLCQSRCRNNRQKQISAAFVDRSVLATIDTSIFGGLKKPSSRAVIELVDDLNDHYSQIASYLRLNGLVPRS